MSSNYKANKISGYVLEPMFDLIGTRWQSHHVTNPAAFRPSFDNRVYLCYRAGGDRDHYCINDIDVWSSSLGLAILNETGEKVEYRLPLPIMKIFRSTPLPQSPQEYVEYNKIHGNDLAVLHDFRIYEYQNYLYVIYHDGSINQAYDCVKRMSIPKFKAKVDKSISISTLPYIELEYEWHKLWWEETEWENAGIDGSRLIYPTKTNKNDIIFLNIDGKSLQMLHRPLPDMAVLDSFGTFHSRMTSDGFSEMGVLETCIRPGYFDNSHIGGNGMPTRAKIGDVDVFIDLCHGVHNKALTKDCEYSWEMIYLPFLRVKDYETGDLLYYSEEPILELDSIWQEYTENGRWIKLLSHIGIMFTGGQIESIKGKNGLDDIFSTYVGVGDTAIARAEFTLRQLIPESVINDIKSKKSHKQAIITVPQNRYTFDTPISGWNWSIFNHTDKRSICISRNIDTNGFVDSAERLIYVSPGLFDADFMLFDGINICFKENIGWCLIYKGGRWTYENGTKVTYIGFGLLILDENNLEKTLYRSTSPLDGKFYVQSGWTNGDSIYSETNYLNDIEEFIPPQVLFEIKKINFLVKEGKHWQSHHTLWLQQRANKINGKENLL